MASVIPTEGEVMKALREIGGHEETPDDFLWLRNDAHHVIAAWPDDDAMAAALIDSGLVCDNDDDETERTARAAIGTMRRIITRIRQAAVS